jgi:hypothetical protein
LEVFHHTQALGGRPLLKAERVDPGRFAGPEAADAPKQFAAIPHDHASSLHAEHVQHPLGLGFPEVEGSYGALDVVLMVEQEDWALGEGKGGGGVEQELSGDVFRL